ncbi:MAG: hypothetical protein A3E16_00410 [Candidatus Blackburnbacteria bacterium RIFCSPHIGHO2_12_FULL_44_25]|nr:MAG: hypothetical protein A3E16_00410 [Candidatus Blackburnbacteria bacterium RIFCSPHIGHO2_12_FULL_44_25]
MYILLTVTKYKKMVNEMLEKNKELFDQFRQTHDKYSLKPQENQEEFNQLGFKVRDVIRKYENILCGKSESSGYSQYSSNLAEKFQDEIRHVFPKIDSIGVKISDSFQNKLKKIKL